MPSKAKSPVMNKTAKTPNSVATHYTASALQMNLNGIKNEIAFARVPLAKPVRAMRILDEISDEDALNDTDPDLRPVFTSTATNKIVRNRKKLAAF